MKEKGEELLVINKKTYFLVIATFAIVGMLTGYTVGYITAPQKEVYVHKTYESEKTVLPSNIETPLTKKQENPPQENPPQSQPLEKKENVMIVQEVEATEKKSTGQKTDSGKATMLDERQLKKHKKALYTLQVGAFSDINNAEALQKKLKEAGVTSYLVKEDFYKVRSGYFKKFKDAKKASDNLRLKGFENFITRTSKTLKGG